MKILSLSFLKSVFVSFLFVFINYTHAQNYHARQVLLEQNSNLNENRNINKTVSATSVPDKKEWTIAIYMAADNDLTEHAIEDIKEMELVGSTEFTNIIVELDTKENTGSKRYYITKNLDTKDANTEKNNINSPTIDILPELDSGSIE